MFVHLNKSIHIQIFKTAKISNKNTNKLLVSKWHSTLRNRNNENLYCKHCELKKKKFT